MARGSVSGLRRLRPSYFQVIAWTGLVLSLAQASALNSVLSVFVKPMSEDLGWTRGTISGVATSGAIASGLLALAVGPRMDRREMRVLTLLGVLLVGGSLAALSQVSQIWSFYALHSLARVGAMSVIGVAVTVVVSNWFTKARGKVMGFAFLGNRVGGAVLPIIALYFVVSYGWRSAWLVLGVMVMLMALPCLIYLRRRPEDAGLLPDDIVTQRKSNHNDPVAEAAGPRAGPTWTLRSAARTPTLWLLAAPASLAYLVMGSVNLHQVPFMTDMGIPAGLAVGTLTVTALSAGAGALLWGMVTERVHVRYALAGAFALEAASMAVLMLVRSPVVAYGYSICGGLAIGGTVSLSGIVWAEYFGRDSVGAIQGLVLPLQMFANAFGPFIAGWAYDLSGEYRGIFSAFGVACLLAVFCVLSAKPREPAVPLPAQL